MKILFFFFILLWGINGFAQHKSVKAIKQVIQMQQNNWNNGNINGFMQGYWENELLMFVGKSGVTYGWQNTLNNYKKGYPDTASMGKLSFNLLEVNKINRKNYFVVGKWFLKRSIGDIGGHFTLFFKRIQKKWVIVADHSS